MGRPIKTQKRRMCVFFMNNHRHEIRTIKIDLLTILKTNKPLIGSLFVLCVIAAGVLGFSFGGSFASVQKEYAFDESEISGVEGTLLASAALCTQIEKREKKREQVELVELNKEITYTSSILEDEIMRELMSNLNEKRLSSRSSDVDSYIQEARNLIELNRKIEAFKKTDDYNLIDISEYEEAVKGALERIPTLKPIPGSFPGYGWRNHPIFGYRQYHAAADQTAAHGTKIRAAATGYVVTASYSRSRGYYIVLNHGNGFTTTYMHNSANTVSSGERVTQGDVIGRVGSTGWSTGPHLHFEVALNGRNFNPRRILIN